MDNLKCIRCGNKLDARDQWCPDCGNAIAQQSRLTNVSVNKLITPNACPACHAKIEPDDLFCQGCGASVLPKTSGILPIAYADSGESARNKKQNIPAFGWALVAGITVVATIGFAVIMSVSKSRSTSQTTIQSGLISQMEPQILQPHPMQDQQAPQSPSYVPQQSVGQQPVEPTKVTCPQCGGKGRIPAIKCSFCNGTGKSHEINSLGYFKDCVYCHGTGLTQQEGQCDLCAGFGSVSLATAQVYQQQMQQLHKINQNFYNNAPQPTEDWVHIGDQPSGQ